MIATEGKILSEPKQCFIAQSPSFSPFHPPDMTEILLKRHKVPNHASIHSKSLGDQTFSLCDWEACIQDKVLVKDMEVLVILFHFHLFKGAVSILVKFSKKKLKFPNFNANPHKNDIFIA